MVWSSTTPSRTGVVGQIHNPKTAGKVEEGRGPPATHFVISTLLPKDGLQLGSQIASKRFCKKHRLVPGNGQVCTDFRAGCII